MTISCYNNICYYMVKINDSLLIFEDFFFFFARWYRNLSMNKFTKCKALFPPQTSRVNSTKNGKKERSLMVTSRPLLLKVSKKELNTSSEYGLWTKEVRESLVMPPNQSLPSADLVSFSFLFLSLSLLPTGITT